MGIPDLPETAVDAVKMLPPPSRVLVAVKKVNPLNCGVATKKVPLLKMPDAVMVHRIPWPHILGRDLGSINGAIGVADVTAPERIQKRELENISHPKTEPQLPL